MVYRKIWSLKAVLVLNLTLSLLVGLSPTRGEEHAKKPSDSSERSPLIRLLIKKGILTEEEARELEEEAAKEAEEKAPPEKGPALSVSGFVDTYYAWNFNRPVGVPTGFPAGSVSSVDNLLHNFDFNHNALSLNLAEIVLERPADLAKGIPGFRVDLDVGPATDWVHSADPSGLDVLKHIQQAYLSIPVRGEKGSAWLPDRIEIGKWVTQHGAEVIETKDNWNYSRSLLFAWAIPYYHAGVRAFWPLNSGNKLVPQYINLYLANGWNNVKENNAGKTLGLQASWAPYPKWSILTNWMSGPEPLGADPGDGNWRHLFDATLTYTASSKWLFALNFDWMNQKADPGHIRWQGLAGYIRYVPGAKDAFTLRSEIFRDHNGVSTGTKQQVMEATLTYERKLSENLITRWEYRRDWSTASVFNKRGRPVKNQDIVLGGFIVIF